MKYAGVGEAFHGVLWDINGKTEECKSYAVACSFEHEKWGAGFGSTWENREAAAKMALAVAIAAETDQETYLKENYSSFAVIANAALDGNQQGGPAAKKAKTGDAPMTGGGGAANGPLVGDDGGMPVSWLSLPPTSQLVQTGMSTDAAGMYNHKSLASLYSSASSILGTLLGETEFTITHDPEWTEFPDIGACLAPAGLPTDQQMTVAMCPGGKWGVGVGGNKALRERTAKMALCVSCASDSPNIREALESYPEFRNLCSTVGLMG